jgi:hypothetical protein
MALGSTQPLTELSTRNLPGGKGRPAHGADNLTVICELIVYKMWEPRRLTTLWAFMACCRDSFTFTFYAFSVSHMVLETAKQKRVLYLSHVKYSKHCNLKSQVTK